MTTLLECRKLDAGYQGKVVVRELDLTLRAGEVMALLGPNGAGKTTTLLTLAGLIPTVGGAISIADREMGRASAASMSRAGLVLVPDDRALFTSLTTRENLQLARRKEGPSPDEILDFFPALRARITVQSGQLSGGEQQMLAIGRAMMQRPKVLLIDELSMGLAPVIVQALLPIVRQIADETSAGVVLVEQHVHLALGVADTAVVLVHGHVALAGPAADVANDPKRLERAYLGD
jgi:branched-chain amino acid transport system ATP-binding protein